MKTRLQWFAGFEVSTVSTVLATCLNVLFFKRTLMHTEIAWPFRVYDLFPIFPYLCLPKASAQAVLQRMVLEWSWSQATGVVLVAKELVTGELVT